MMCLPCLPSGLPHLLPGLTPQKLVADFLRCLLSEVVLPTLTEHYRNRYMASGVACRPGSVWQTVRQWQQGLLREQLNELHHVWQTEGGRKGDCQV